jgi:hypothetical protein
MTIAQHKVAGLDVCNLACGRTADMGHKPAYPSPRRAGGMSAMPA